MKLDIQTLDAKKAGSIELDDAVFGIKDVRADILHRMVKYQLAKRRAGTHKTLSRGEVARSHSKIYKQKGTGQARHGAARASLVAFINAHMGPNAGKAPEAVLACY